MESKETYEINIDKERCKGCGLCVAYCPKKAPENVLKMSEDKETNENGYNFAKVVNITNCTGCANCGVICPEPACVEIKKYD